MFSLTNARSLSLSLSLSLPFASHFSPLAKFLGNQLLSYGQTLWIRFLSETPELLPQSVSVVMEGSGMAVSAQLSRQNDQLLQGQSTAVFTLR